MVFFDLFNGPFCLIIAYPKIVLHLSIDEKCKDINLDAWCLGQYPCAMHFVQNCSFLIT